MVSGSYFRLDENIQGQIQEFKPEAPNSLSQIGKPLGGWVYCLPIFHNDYYSIYIYIYIYSFFQFIYYYNIVQHKHPHSPIYIKKNTHQIWTHERTTELHLLVVNMSVQSISCDGWIPSQYIELQVSRHGIRSRTRHTELIPQAVISWTQNCTHTLCHLRVGHLAGTKQSPDAVISQASPRGHETAPRHRHLAGVTSRARNSPPTLPSRGRHLAGTKQHPDTATSRASQGSQ